MINKQNEDIPIGATHKHYSSGLYYCVGQNVTRYVDGKWELPYSPEDVAGWLKHLKPIEQKHKVFLNLDGFTLPCGFSEKIIEHLSQVKPILNTKITVTTEGGLETVVMYKGVVDLLGTDYNMFDIISVSYSMVDKISEEPTIKPQDAFIADLDKMLHQRGLDIANAIQRKLEASEGIPIEWLNELITYYGVSR